MWHACGERGSGTPLLRPAYPCAASVARCCRAADSSRFGCSMGALRLSLGLVEQEQGHCMLCFLFVYWLLALTNACAS